MFQIRPAHRSQTSRSLPSPEGRSCPRRPTWPSRGGRRSVGVAEGGHPTGGRPGTPGAKSRLLGRGGGRKRAVRISILMRVRCVAKLCYYSRTCLSEFFFLPKWKAHSSEVEPFRSW